MVIKYTIPLNAVIQYKMQFNIFNRAPGSSIKPVRVVFHKNPILLFFEVYIHYETIICHCDILF